MRAFLTRALIVASSLLIAATVSAQATQGLERVGPTSPTNGYPTWYQDKTGITLEFCTPQNAVELSGGWCLLLPADTTAPETFPTPFSEEHFYWAAGATLAANLGATLTLGLEGAFANGPVINGDQITFARVRFKFRAPVAGQYTVYHPYGTKVVTAAAGELVFITEDVGLTCPPGTFDCALRGAIGPFLLASSTPGGPELPAIAGPVPGALYIADPARLGPVTGSPVNQNFFRITGPAIDVSTNDFSLMGRLYTANLGGRVTVDRASYSRDAGQVNGELDVFATAFATAQPRVPGSAITGASVPALGFFPTACAVGAGGALGSPGGAPVQMFGADTRYYGQVTGAIPTAVCVQDVTARDANGQIVSSYTQKTVTDMVTISQALYNPASGGSLTVAAVSSDANIPPTLTVSGFGSFTSGASLSLLVGVPPSKVLVTSANGGFAEIEVSTNPGQPQLPQAPFAASDAFIIAEDSGANSLNVLANDTFGGAAVVAANTTINIVQQGALGIATVANGAIVFTPALNKFGSDLLQYSITDIASGTTSPVTFVQITINNVNDAPVAVNDTAQGVANLGISVNLLANDSDPDGAADLVGANILTVSPAVAFTLVGGTLSFTAAAGTYTFTYQAKDVLGALSNVATVTVTLSGAETLAITRADYIVNKRRWRVDGTSSVSSDQTVFVVYANGTFADGTSAAGFLVGTTQVVGGLFTLDLTLAGSNDPRNPASSTVFSVRPTAVYTTTSLGGRSAVRTLNFR